MEMEKSQQELMMKLSMFEQQIQHLNQQLQAVGEGIVEMNSLSLALDELKDKKGEEILSPLGRGIFTKTKLISEDLIVDIGGKNFVKKSIPEAKKIIEKVWDLENKQIKEWPYKFDNFFEIKKEHIFVLKRKYVDAMKKKKKKLEAAKEVRRWAAAAGTKQKYRLAKRLEREAKKLDEVENPFDFIKDINIDFNSKSLHNCTIFRLENIGKKFDKILFENVNQEIEFGEKICIVGENGAGKSTLLKMLIGKSQPSKGNLYRRKDVKIGYFDQELEGIDKEKTIMEFFLDETGIDEEKLMSILSQYGFKKETVQKKIKYLSGGEKGRLNILRISLEKNNILVLDEPTNNLDFYLIESLENALNEFEGTIVFVSHDRYFVDKIANRILQIKDKKISSFKGNYSEYLESQNFKLP